MKQAAVLNSGLLTSWSQMKLMLMQLDWQFYSQRKGRKFMTLDPHVAVRSLLLPLSVDVLDRRASEFVVGEWRLH